MKKLQQWLNTFLKNENLFSKTLLLLIAITTIEYVYTAENILQHDITNKKEEDKEGENSARVNAYYNLIFQYANVTDEQLKAYSDDNLQKYANSLGKDFFLLKIDDHTPQIKHLDELYALVSYGRFCNLTSLSIDAYVTSNTNPAYNKTLNRYRKYIFSCTTLKNLIALSDKIYDNIPYNKEPHFKNWQIANIYFFASYLQSQKNLNPLIQYKEIERIALNALQAMERKKLQKNKT